MKRGELTFLLPLLLLQKKKKKVWGESICNISNPFGSVRRKQLVFRTINHMGRYFQGRILLGNYQYALDHHQSTLMEQQEPQISKVPETRPVDHVLYGPRLLFFLVVLFTVMHYRDRKKNKNETKPKQKNPHTLKNSQC